MNTTAFRPVVVIPVFDHEHAVGAMVDGVLAVGQACLLVDDGSRPSCAAVLQDLARREGVHLVRLEVNQGKGGAMLAGFREAGRMGASHVLQIDADGQHDTADIPRFLAASEAEPGAVIAGAPCYDESVPKGRLYGRYLTHVWVWINTLSLHLRDSMCGFRVYPLPATVALIESTALGKRMDFDPDILVRLAWRNQPMQWLPTKVHYPLDGLSHFRLLHDNALISKMHAKLFFGMLLRAPLILWRRWRG